MSQCHSGQYIPQPTSKVMGLMPNLKVGHWEFLTSAPIVRVQNLDQLASTAFSPPSAIFIMEWLKQSLERHTVNPKSISETFTLF